MRFWLLESFLLRRFIMHQNRFSIRFFIIVVVDKSRECGFRFRFLIALFISNPSKLKLTALYSEPEPEVENRADPESRPESTVEWKLFSTTKFSGAWFEWKDWASSCCLFQLSSVSIGQAISSRECLDTGRDFGDRGFGSYREVRSRHLYTSFLWLLCLKQMISRFHNNKAVGGCWNSFFEPSGKPYPTWGKPKP